MCLPEAIAVVVIESVDYGVVKTTVALECELLVKQPGAIAKVVWRSQGSSAWSVSTRRSRQRRFVLMAKKQH